MPFATPRNQPPRVVLGLLLCLSLSCGPEGGADAAARGERLGGRADWELVPGWVYSGSDSTAVRWIQDAIILPDGRILVGTNDAFALTLLDSGGQLLHSFGRKGEGPGEFLSVGRGSLAPYRGDSIAVYDYRSRRITIFSGTGAFGRVVVPAPWRDIPAPMALLFRGVLDDGTTADWIVFDVQGRPIGRVRLPRPAEVLATDGQRVLVQHDAAIDDQVALYRVVRAR